MIYKPRGSRSVGRHICNVLRLEDYQDMASALLLYHESGHLSHSGDPMPQIPTTVEELHAVRDLILLHQCLGTLNFRLARAPESERDQVQRIIDKVTADFVAIKVKLKERDIHVHWDDVVDNGPAVKYPFVCRGYDDRLFTLKDHYRGLIKEKIKEYKA